MKSLYPRAFKTPEGRALSIKTMANALRVIKQDPEKDYPGWNWFETSGHRILASFRSGLHDRINRRAI